MSAPQVGAYPDTLFPAPAMKSMSLQDQQHKRPGGDGMKAVFYLGTPPQWLWNGVMAGIPLFVSHGRLKSRKSTFPAATVPGWALDSEGFSILQRHGRWTVTPREYTKAVIRYDRQIGRLQWAAPQDRMCERQIIEGGIWGGQQFAGTRQFIDPSGTLTCGQIAEIHQRDTVANFRELTALWHEYRRQGECEGASPYMPVVQGDPEDIPASHLRCAQMYVDAGVRLHDYPVVGVGSVCRIQDTPAIGRLARALAPLGLPLHWFGVKLAGLPLIWPHISSHDSQGWSAAARREPRIEGCTHVRTRGKYVGQPSTCANCPRAARAYYDQVTALDETLSARDWQGELVNPDFEMSALAALGREAGRAQPQRQG